MIWLLAHLLPHKVYQRVLKDLKRTTFSCSPMIRLLAQPLSPLSRRQVVSLSQASCVAGHVYWWEKRRRRGWASSQIIRPRESLALYKSFNTLWSVVKEIAAVSRKNPKIKKGNNLQKQLKITFTSNSDLCCPHLTARLRYKILLAKRWASHCKWRAGENPT